MSFLQFIKDKTMVLVLNVLCMVLLFIYLMAIGTDITAIGFIIIVWLLILTTYGFLTFHSRKKYFSDLHKIVDRLEQKYLISEVMNEPSELEGLLYYNLIRKATKSMMEQITRVRHGSKEYKEYIEQWVHEIKNPIAAIKLMCENDRTGALCKVQFELEKIDHFVEQVLFYARSENVEKDYFIKEFPLVNAVNTAIIKNKQVLQNAVVLQISEITETVYSDEKWIGFVLHQLIQNAIKYKKASPVMLTIYTEKQSNGVFLNIEDNGIGICKSDLPRVFDKGFTGLNGRKIGKSTGVGLYLCKQMCKKLGHEMTISSQQHQYTRVTIFFPKGTFTKMQD